MKDQFKYFTAGVFIGISELLPGISGATVALMFGVYEKILNFLIKFYKKHKFIRIYKKNTPIGTKNVINTNYCDISICESNIKNKIIILSYIIL